MDFLDIEVLAPEDRFPSVEIASDPIVSIASYDNYMNKVVVFAFKSDYAFPDGKDWVKVEGEYRWEESDRTTPMTKYIYKSERKMLMMFTRFVSDTDPDIVTGWNSSDFDLPYIVYRMQHSSMQLKRYAKFLSPMLKVYVVDNARGKEGGRFGGKKRARYRPMIGGRICFDLLTGHHNIKGKHETGHSLNAVSQRELHKIQKHSDHIMGEDWYETDFDRFLDYNVRDTELCVEIDRRVGVIAFHDMVQSFNACLWDKVFMKSVIVDSFMLFRSRDIALPTKIRRERGTFEGAMVFQPIPGIYGQGGSYQVYFDLAKMYPNIIRSGNLSPEMIVDDDEPDDPERMFIFPNGHRFWKPVRVPDGEEWDPETMVEMDGRWFWKETVGFVSQRLTEMFEIRYIIERQMEKCDYGSYEFQNLLDMRQSVKDTINAVWGWMAYPGARMYRLAIAETITWMGRELIKWTSDIAKGLGFETIYGDTDSIIVDIPADTIEECIVKCDNIRNHIEASYDVFADNLGMENHFFGIEYEKILSFMIFGSAKKRYAGMLVWADGRKVYRNNEDGTKTLGQLFYRGLELRRSDSAWITKEVQRTIFTMLGDKADRQTVFNYVYDVVHKMLDGGYTHLQVGIPKGLSRSLSDYEIASPWIRGAEYSNEYLRGNFGAGSKPKLLYVSQVVGGQLPQTDEVCIDVDMPQLPESIHIDWRKMAEKTIHNKIAFILEAIGIEWDTILTGIASESLTALLEGLN